MSYADIASKLSSILGRNIRHVNLDVDQLAERYHAGGLDKDYAQTLASMDKWIEDGNEDRVTDCVFVLTRQAPKSADVFIRENHQRWLS
ncbi:hypothetical protein RRU01S_34_00290 [Agrobacterium rubi TR3 = NBRC 13261]|uniref:Uncharacterized protein n=1 Tax=Agrobacterium rubi TR3 = NBRC 13261 TaxID=1368415 RepID=A0A081D2X7_9HYPH|nr:hypothetical protein RRU01S_34_00290 [Agrobacterium rubi TR3 = NBRC 13261]